MYRLISWHLIFSIFSPGEAANTISTGLMILQALDHKTLEKTITVVMRVRKHSVGSHFESYYYMILHKTILSHQSSPTLILAGHISAITSSTSKSTPRFRMEKLYLEASERVRCPRTEPRIYLRICTFLDMIKYFLHQVDIIDHKFNQTSPV